VLRWALLGILFHLFAVPLIYLYPDILYADLLYDRAELLNSVGAQTSTEAYVNYVLVREPYSKSYITGELLHGDSPLATCLRYGLWIRTTSPGMLLCTVFLVALAVFAAVVKRGNAILVICGLGLLLYWVFYLWLAFESVSVSGKVHIDYFLEGGLRDWSNLYNWYDDWLWSWL